MLPLFTSISSRVNNIFTISISSSVTAMNKAVLSFNKNVCNYIKRFVEIILKLSTWNIMRIYKINDIEFDFCNHIKKNDFKFDQI